MRIVIDLQGAQTESRLRGIGRYSLSFAKAIARNRGGHDVVIVLSGYYPDTIDEIRHEFRELVPSENICVWHAPSPIHELGQGNAWRRAAAELIREEFIARLQPDIVHISSLFEGHVDNAACSIGRFTSDIPVSVSLYDLIPMINPDVYLRPKPAYKKYYLEKVENAKRADLFLTISEHTRNETLEALSPPPETVVNVSTAAEPHFEQQAIEPQRKTDLFAALGITRDFVLHTGGADDRKNLARLVEAFSNTRPEAKKKYQLVLAGRIPDGHLQHLEKTAKRAGLQEGDILYTGQVSDDDLVALYNLCTLFVMPSWHEGFGLPALEAMSCGAATLGANITSLPEVIDNQDALFDPFSVDDIASKVGKALANEEFREALCEKGLEKAKDFSWDRSAQTAIDAFEKTVAKHGAAIWPGENFCRTVVRKVPGIETRDKPTDHDLVQVATCIDSSSKSLLTYRMKNTGLSWRLEGPFDSSYSLAVLNRETALGMTELGCDVALHSTEGPGDFEPSARFLEVNPPLAELYRRSLERPAGHCDVVSRNLYPPRVHDMDGDLCTLHHYAWEETGFPSDWVNEFNNNLDGISCLSSHVRKILIDNGVSTPTTVSGCGVDHWERLTASDRYPLVARAFRFLHVSSCFPRKGADCLLQAYGSAFSADDDVTLVIKTFPNPHNNIEQLLEQARNHSSSFPDVVIITDDLEEADLKALYHECDVLVAPSKAEGYGLPMAEAMLSGLPVITTGWSGQLDFCHEDNAWLVDFQFERADTHFGIFLSAWARPEIPALTEAMRQAHEATPQTLRDMANRGRKELLDNHKWVDASARYIDAVERFIDEPDGPIPRLAWLSTWNTKCGIALYSNHLVSNLNQDNVRVFAPFEPVKRSGPDEGCIRNWNQGKSNNGLAELHNALDDMSLNTVVIQFNYGFFNHEELSDFILKCREMNRQVILMLHSTIDPADKRPVENYQLSSIRTALAACSRILVHSVGDLNRMKDLDLLDNVALFPHGVLKYEGSTNAAAAPKPRPLIASYGFCLPHKGLTELVEATALLRERGEDVSLRLVNAEFPAPQSAAMIKELTELISRLDLSDRVTLNNDFLPDDESLSLLAEADLVVFPYQETGESSSAAIRQGLASKRPVAVTPLAIFDDTAGATFRFSGTSVESIADGISDFLGELRTNSDHAQTVENNAERWRAEFDYAAASGRLWGICSALLR